MQHSAGVLKPNGVDTPIHRQIYLDGTVTLLCGLAGCEIYQQERVEYWRAAKPGLWKSRDNHVSRILKAYRTRYYQLLRSVGARDPQKGADWFVARAERESVKRHIPLSASLTHSFEELAARPVFRLRKPRPVRSPADVHFFCDAGVGGLARWLRAAGYDVLWEPHIADEALLQRARESGATIITTDSMLMERRLLRDQVIPSFWLPPILSIAEQLERVFGEFNLCVGAPRCMRCGGELVASDKDALQSRIPPRTYRWLDDYFVCARCGKLFWHGTHWSRIRNRLDGLKQCPLGR